MQVGRWFRRRRPRPVLVAKISAAWPRSRSRALAVVLSMGFRGHELASGDPRDRGSRRRDGGDDLPGLLDRVYGSRPDRGGRRDRPDRHAGRLPSRLSDFEVHDAEEEGRRHRALRGRSCCSMRTATSSATRSFGRRPPSTSPTATTTASPATCRESTPTSANRSQQGDRPLGGPGSRSATTPRTAASRLCSSGAIELEYFQDLYANMRLRRATRRPCGAATEPCSRAARRVEVGNRYVTPALGIIQYGATQGHLPHRTRSDGKARITAVMRPGTFGSSSPPP